MKIVSCKRLRLIISQQNLRIPASDPYLKRVIVFLSGGWSDRAIMRVPALIGYIERLEFDDTPSLVGTHNYVVFQRQQASHLSR